MNRTEDLDAQRARRTESLLGRFGGPYGVWVVLGKRNVDQIAGKISLGSVEGPSSPAPRNP